MFPDNDNHEIFAERILHFHELMDSTTDFYFHDLQIQRIIRVYQDLKGACLIKHLRPVLSIDSMAIELQKRGYRVVPALIWHVATVMERVEAYRLRFKYGTPEARTYRDFVSPELTWSVFALDILLSVLLLGAHRTYRARLLSTAPGGLVYLPEFRHLMENLLPEWAGESCCI